MRSAEAMVTCEVCDFGIRLCQFRTDTEALVLKRSRAGPRYVAQRASCPARKTKYALYNIGLLRHNMLVTWEVRFHEEFDPEFDDLPEEVQDELLAHAKLLEQFGPQLGRPRVDTLDGSRHANMKELRFNAADGVWRVAFAFDPQRRALLLVCGDKAGVSEKRFYRELIHKADKRFDDYLARAKKE